MLENTFCHIPRVSLNKEKDLWRNGVLTWEDYRKVAKKPAFIDESLKYLREGEPRFFADSMKSDQHWRLFGNFRDSVAYLDIETTGLSKDYDQISTIALFDGEKVHTYVNGQNLDKFKTDIKKYKLLVTYNGRCFDVPFVESFFCIKLNHAHIDLRYVLKKLGYSGGLKQCERNLGIDRGQLKSVDGFFAVSLWSEYQRKKNEAALQTLLAYNCADAINLEQLMVMAYNLNLKETPFNANRKIALPKPFPIPFDADSKIVNRLSYH